MEDARPVGREQIEDGAALALIFSRAEEAAGFEKNGVDGFLRADDFVADLNDVVGRNEGAEVFHWGSIDSDSAFADEGFDSATGSEAGGGEVTIEAHEQRDGLEWSGGVSFRKEDPAMSGWRDLQGAACGIRVKEGKATQ